MRCRSLAFYILLLAMPVAVGSAQAPTFTDAQVRSYLDSLWGAAPDLGFVIGEVRFIDPVAAHRVEDPTMGEDAVSELPLYRAYAARGFITISNEHAQTEGGVRRTATVALTPGGRSAGRVVQIGAGYQELFFHIGQTKVADIVANDTLFIGTSRLRDVRGTYSLDLPDDIKAAWTAARSGTARDRKFRILLMYDRTSASWRPIAADVAERSQEYTTTSVDTQIARLRVCGAPAC